MFTNETTTTDDKNGKEEEEEEDGKKEKEKDEEHISFEKIINAFRYYRRHSLHKLHHDYTAFGRLPERQRALLTPKYPNHLVQLKNCIEINNSVLLKLIADVGEIFENRDHQVDVLRSQLRPASDMHMDKLRSTLRQITREWTAEGCEERESCSRLLIDTVLEHYPDRQLRRDVHILVPGAGLGRLAWDFARLGFSCQGNEFSLFMLFASNFILNRCVEVNQFTIHPWIHESCNNWTYEDQLRPITFPDVNPSDLPKDGNTFSMSAGDFLEVYEKDIERWDCVVTMFFLDTAHNLLSYMETIYRILKKGGIWVNMGPLLYHFADATDLESIELPYEEVRRLVLASGFRIDREETNVPASYTTNKRSMLQYRYNCAFFSCTKVEQ